MFLLLTFNMQLPAGMLINESARDFLITAIRIYWQKKYKSSIVLNKISGNPEISWNSQKFFIPV